MKLTKYLAAAAVSAAFIAAPASAGTIGMADLTIESLFLIDQDNNPITTGFTISNDTRTGNASSSFNGVEGTGAGSGNIGSITPGASVDVQYRCAGPSCGNLAAVYGDAENNTSTHVGTPSGNYALGDMFIAGSALGASGANGLTRADASVMGPDNTGSSNSTIQNSVRTSTTFTVGTTINASFALDYNAYVAAYVEAAVPSNVAANSSGTVSWALTLQEVRSGMPNLTIMQWTPNQVNIGVTSTTFAENTIWADAGITTSAATFGFTTLTAGTTYLLTINQASNALASEIPEPGSMLLVAMGLFALGAASRRRNK